MSLIENRAANCALQHRVSLNNNTENLPYVADLVKALAPTDPLHCIRPAVIAGAAQSFGAAFNGDVLYAVKCNPEPAVLRAIWEGGIRHFDCASLNEVTLVRRMFPGAHIHFMHPVKSRPAIAQAWQLHGVRDFVLDSFSELEKIGQEIGGLDTARPGLFIRIALPETGAAINLSKKFGADFATAVALLRAARPHAQPLGLAFHAGSQCLDPRAWRDAIALAGEVIRAAGVQVDVLDVGGGFPAAYPDVDPPALGAFIAEINAGHAKLAMPGLKLWAEPGRALVAGGSSLVVQVQLRKGNMLYINDGVYGTLFDAGILNARFPTRLLRKRHSPGAPDAAFSFSGPSCDSYDVMAGPFILPDDVAEGDWIEIGQLGAYGSCMRTAFNGFDQAMLVEVADRAMLDTPGYALPAAGVV